MSAIIEKPGFYSSKAGKCEVVAVKDGYAFGFVQASPSVRWVRIWSCASGYEACANITDDAKIDGPYVEPRKPVEAYAVCWPDGTTFFLTDQETEARMAFKKFPEARLVHLREYEDS